MTQRGHGPRSFFCENIKPSLVYRDMTTTKDIIEKLNLKATVRPTDRNPNMVSEMPRGSRHYHVEFRRRDEGKLRRLSCYYSMGPAHERDPDPAEVMECLASEALLLECAYGFEDWAQELGYDLDSPTQRRKAERAFNTLTNQRMRLERFMNGSYESLLQVDPD